MEVFKKPDPDADALLVERIRSGDQQAEQQLYERYSRGVTIILRQATGGSSAVADLCQETFRITLIKIRQGDIRNPERLSAFIWGTARNVAIEHFRKTASEAKTDISSAAEVTDPAPNQLDHLIEQEEAEIIRNVIKQIKSRKGRQVLYRFYIAEEPKEQICADLRLTSLQFNLVLFRARKQYKELYEKAMSKKH